MTTAKRWAISEMLAVFTLVMVAIWFLQSYIVPFAAILGLLAVVVGVGFAVRLRRSSTISGYAEDMGLGHWNHRDRRLTIYCSWAGKLAFGTIIALALILRFGFHFKPNFWLAEDFWKVKIFIGVQKYVWWGMLQQLFLQGFITNNLYFIFAKAPNPETCEERAAILTSVMSGILFFVVHAPNPTLMIVTPIAGAATAYIFLHCRNIYMLGIAHGILGVTIKWCLADSMRIGPLYWVSN